MRRRGGAPWDCAAGLRHLDTTAAEVADQSSAAVEFTEAERQITAIKTSTTAGIYAALFVTDIAG